MRIEDFIKSVSIDCQVDEKQIIITDKGVMFKITDSDCEFAFDVYDIVQGDRYNFIAFPKGVE